MKSFSLSLALTLYFLLQLSAVYSSGLDGFFIEVPFTINAEPSGNTTIWVTPLSNEVLIEAKPLFEKFEELLKKAVYEELEKLIDDNGFLNPMLTFPDGITISFDAKLQFVQINISPSLLKQKSTSLSYKSSTSKKDMIKPSSFSSYLNLLFGQKYKHELFKGFFENRSPMFVSMNMVSNFKGAVLEGFANISDDDNHSFNRGDVLLTLDQVDYSLRHQLGDVNPPSVGFQNTLPLLGYNLSKNKQLFLDTVTGPISRHELFLNTPSRVDVFVDGLNVNTLELPAGPHLVEDFPLYNGLNDIQLKILDAAGREQLIDLSMLYDSSLLAKGLDEYSFSFGFPRYNDIKQRYTYEFNNPAFSGFYKRGFSNTLTLSSYLQLSKQEVFAGVISNYITKYFKGSMEYSGSYARDQLFGGKLRATFDSLPKKNQKFFWQVGSEITSKYFGFFGSKERNNSQRLLLFGSVSKSLPFKIQSSLGAQYIYERPTSHSYNIQLSLLKKVFKSMSLNLYTTYIKSGNSPPNYNAVIGFTWTPKKPSGTVSSFYNTEQKTSQTTTSFTQPLKGSRQINGSLGLQTAPKAKTASGTFNYLGSMSEVRSSYYLAKSSLTNVDSTVSVTNINVGTAFAYAGNSWGLSRPISDSFIIIKPKKFLSRYPIEINPSSDGNYLATTSRFFNVVIPNVRSYQPFHISLGSESIPIGYELGKTHFQFLPTFKSGASISIGEKAGLLVEGTLVEKDQKKLSSIFGKICSVSTEFTKPFFTNREGKFQIIGLQPGNYYLYIKQLTTDPIKITIPGNSETGYVDLGTIEVSL